MAVVGGAAATVVEIEVCRGLGLLAEHATAKAVEAFVAIVAVQGAACVLLLLLLLVMV